MRAIAAICSRDEDSMLSDYECISNLHAYSKNKSKAHSLTN